MILILAIFFSILIIGIIITFFILFYNRFQVLKNGAETALSQIDVALQKRLDMISQLVESVKGYATYEQNVMKKITEMRSNRNEKKNTENIDNVNKESTGLLEKMLLVVEGYPDLKTTANVSDLMKSIIQVEDEITRLRYTYNNIVQDYNTRRESFPSNIVSKIFSLTKLDYLQFEKLIKIKPDMTWNK